MKKVGIILLFISGFLQPALVYAQGRFIDPREAENDYKNKDYKAAMKVFKELLEQKPGDMEYHYKIGICYLKTNIDKAQAVTYFEWITKQAKFDNEVWYELGKAYHYAYQFKDAIKAFDRYKQNTKNAGDITKADKEIEECTNGIQLMKYPLSVTFQNLGKEINTSYPDYYPLVNQNESMLIFTTRRPGPTSHTAEIDGYYSSDIYIAYAVKGKWQKAKSIGSQINTPDDEEAVGLNPSGNELVMYFDHIKQYGKIYYSKRRGRTFSAPVEYDKATINAGFQSSGSISPDGNTLFFASNRAGGYGETDIYMVKKLPNGKWAMPQNLGPNVNTPYKEDFPWLDIDGCTLYFSSQGHTSMGDFDLFKSEWTNPDSNNWTQPQNLGYPINTTGDDRCISFTANHRVAYVSRVRPEGYGDFDIYRVVFNSLRRYAVVRGKIITGDTTKPINATITATDIKTQNRLIFKSSPNNGDYVMALLPGIYAIKIVCNGFNQTLTDTIIIYDLSSFRAEVVKNYSFITTQTSIHYEKTETKSAHSFH